MKARRKLYRGEFCALVRLFAEREMFNCTHHETDEDSDDHAEATYYKTERQMRDTPIRTSDDALALIDWLERNECIETWCGDGEGLVEALIESLRTYLRGRNRDEVKPKSKPRKARARRAGGGDNVIPFPA
jgi:hypothetical protein